MNKVWKLGLLVSLSIAFSLIAIELVKAVTGRRYEFIECKGVTMIFHSEWSGSGADCSIARVKNGRRLAITVDSVECVELEVVNQRVLEPNPQKSPWVRWATIQNAVVYLRPTNTGVDFIKWRDRFAISGHALVPGYNLKSPSPEDSVVNWHISNIRRTD